MARGSKTGEIEFAELPFLLESAGIPRRPDGPSRELRDHMAVLAHMARGKWIGLAKERLRTSQRAYENSIEMVETEDFGQSLSLENKSSDGILANMIEHGSEGQDLRQNLLNNRRPGSNAIQFSKDGTRYRVIPFRRSTAESTGRSNPIMGAAYLKENMLTQRQVARLRSKTLAKLQESQGLTQKQSTFKGAGGQTYVRFRTVNWGTSIKKGEGGPLLRLINQEKSLHKSGLFAGMYRIRGNSSSQYIMFRTISDKKDGNASWMQGRLEARNLAMEVVAYIERKAPEVLAMQLDNIMRPY
ncbi:MAG: hypothetical protein WC262_09800 [Bacteroidales bacterium]|jgi:hypothetical protein